LKNVVQIWIEQDAALATTNGVYIIAVPREGLLLLISTGSKLISCNKRCVHINSANMKKLNKKFIIVEEIMDLSREIKPYKIIKNHFICMVEK